MDPLNHLMRDLIHAEAIRCPRCAEFCSASEPCGAPAPEPRDEREPPGDML